LKAKLLEVLEKAVRIKNSNSVERHFVNNFVNEALLGRLVQRAPTRREDFLCIEGVSMSNTWLCGNVTSAVDKYMKLHDVRHIEDDEDQTPRRKREALAAFAAPARSATPSRQVIGGKAASVASRAESARSAAAARPPVSIAANAPDDSIYDESLLY